MIVKDKPKRKFIGDIPEEEMLVIERACEIEKSSKISLIRRATTKYANEVIKKFNKENK